MKTQMHWMAMNFRGVLRREQLEGREHVVAPVAMLAEGVWEGSKGAIFYPQEELERCVPTCNHRPSIVYHPEPDEDGRPQSGCKPVILNTQKVGVLLNTTCDDKLRGELYIDPERANQVDQRVLNRLDAGQLIECSTGLLYDPEFKKGEWEGKPYDIIAHNIRLDHLAILPDQLGAYSVKDGAGVMQYNSAKNQPEFASIMLRRGIEEALKRMGGVLVGNEMSHDDISRQLSSLLAAQFGERGKYWDGYICAVYNNRVVFSMPNVGGDSSGRYTKFVMEYTNKDGVVALRGKAQAVREVVQYETLEAKNSSYVSDESGQLVVLSKREANMSFDKKAHIDSLIQAGVCAEGNRATLESLSDDALQALTIPKPPVAENKKTESKPEDKPEAKPQSFSEWRKSGPPDEVAAINEVLNSFQEQRNELIDQIVANKSCGFTKEELSDIKRWDMNSLKRLAKLAKSKTEEEEAENAGDGMGNIFNAGVAVANKSKRDETVDNNLLPLPTPGHEMYSEAAKKTSVA